MSGNTYGKAFCLTSFGESHGTAIGGVVDGMPAKIKLDLDAIQNSLNKRRPGANNYTTPRNENDSLEIISGVLDGYTTGTPIAFLIKNSDKRSKDYDNLKGIIRPGHGDLAYLKKYGIFDHRGGGRASARETAIRVVGGALAQQFLQSKEKVIVRAYLSSIGPIDIKFAGYEYIDQDIFAIPNNTQEDDIKKYLAKLKQSQDSCGAQIKVVAENMPAGLGEPVYDKLDAELAKAFMSINAVKAVEIGAGVACARALGSEHRDSIREDETSLTNNAGGILAGISTGANIEAKLSFKPTSSINMPINTINTAGEPVELKVTGRHDPCVALRAIPIVEAMTYLVLADHYLRYKGYV